jgi:ubiquitin C-terminal hydrolase
LQTTEITRLPKAILLHLKRFIVDVSPDYTSISYRKDQSEVSFDATLDFDVEGVLHEFLAPDVSLPPGDTYAIRTVVNHIGSSASCGHYTADANRKYGNTNNNNNREWTRFNDSYVSKISSKNAIQDSCQTAYMIMYEVDTAPVEKGCVLV